MHWSVLTCWYLKHFFIYIRQPPHPPEKSPWTCKPDYCYKTLLNYVSPVQLFRVLLHIYGSKNGRDENISKNGCWQCRLSTSEVDCRPDWCFLHGRRRPVEKVSGRLIYLAHLPNKSISLIPLIIHSKLDLLSLCGSRYLTATRVQDEVPV